MKNSTPGLLSCHLKSLFCPAVLAGLAVTVLSADRLQAQATVATIGGGAYSQPYAGFVDGNTLTTAKFANPCGMAIDSTGAHLYIADYTNNAIRVVTAIGNTATCTTATWATNGVSRPIAVALDGSGSVYVLNHGTGANGAVLHFTGAGGTAVLQPALAAGLVNATSMAIDGANNLYVTVNGNKVIRVSSTGVVTNFGTITNVSVSLQGIAVLDTGKLALTDAGNNGVWIMNPDGTSTKFTGFHGAGDILGASTVAAFNAPATIAEAGGGILVVADRNNNKVKLIDTAGTVTLLYGVSSTLWVTGTGTWPGWADGTGGAAKGSAESRLPNGVVVAPDGSVIVDEDYYHVLRHALNTGLTAPPAPGVPSPGGGGGTSGGTPSLAGPAGIAYDAVDNLLFVTVTTNNAVQVLNLNATTNATGSFITSADGVTNPVAVLLDADENIYVLNQGKSATNGYILEFDIFGNSYGPIVTGLKKPTAFTMDGLGNLFVTEQSSNIFAFGAGVSNVVVTVTNANVSLQGIALFDDGTVAVSDAGNHVIWVANPITKLVARLTGKFGVSGTAVGATNFAQFNQPHQLVRAGGNQLVGADYGNNRLVLIQRNGYVTTNKFNTGAGATIWFGNNVTDPVLSTNSHFVRMALPVGVAVDGSGDVFASESLYGDVRKIPGTALGTPTSNPGVPLPVYSNPSGMSLNNEGTVLFVADPINNTISALDLANNQTTVFLDETSGIYQPVDVAVDVNDNVYVLNQGAGGNGSIMEFDQYGNFLGTIVTSLPMPTAMKLNFGGSFYVTELTGLVQQFGLGTSNTLANITTNLNVRLRGIAVLDTGSVVVSDTGNHVIWKIAPGSGTAVLFTGVLGTNGTTFGAAGFAKLNAPIGLATANGGLLAIADSGNNRVVVAADDGSVTKALNSTNANLWFGLPTDPLTPTSPNFVSMLTPVSLVIAANGTVYDSEAVYKVIRGILNTGLQPPIKPAPPTAPKIGWFDYEGNALNGFFTVLHPVTSAATYNNDQLLAIDPGTNGVSTYYVVGPPPLNSVPSATNGSSPPFYQDGLVYAQPLTSPSIPDYVIRAVNIDAIGQASPMTTAEFIFKAANPTISGNNAAQFTVSDISSNVVYWYNLNSKDDPTNGPPNIGPVLSDTNNDPVSFSLIITSNTLFKVRAYRNNYLPSGVAVQSFSPGDYHPNAITFGTSGGELHSSFLARPGQFYYAPVTLQLLAGFGKMYSMQFNVGVTNGYTNIINGNPIQPIVNGAGIDFFSMLMTAVPAPEGTYYPPLDGSWYLTLPAWIPAVTSITTNLQRSIIVNTNNNLLGVGWFYRTGVLYSDVDTNGVTDLDFKTTKQDLIDFSIAHDTLFKPANGTVIAGAYSFQVPSNAVVGDQYFIQIGSPSATTDGVGAPGSSIFLQQPIQSQAVTVTSPPYLVGDAAPFRWLNAGDFGDTNLDNSDVMQVYQCAILTDADGKGVDMPPLNSDLYAAMDSAGGFGVLDAANNYYTNAATPTAAQQQAMWDGNDFTINTNAFGDGKLDINDLFVTFRRSEDSSLVWFNRYWTNGMFVAVPTPNKAFNSNSPNVVLAKNVTAKVNSSGTTTTSGNFSNSAAVFMAGDGITGAGSTIQIPITANILGAYPLRVLGLNLTVRPLDGSPDITNTVSFVSAIGSPSLPPGSRYSANYNAAWLVAADANHVPTPGWSSNVTLGKLIVQLPPNATSSSAYSVHFDFVSGSPNGLVLFPKTTFNGLITTSPRLNSSFGDGIPDSWRLRWFGTVNNVLSASNACPSGDGVPNWKKFVAGVDPNVPNNFPSVNPKTAPTNAVTAIHWPSVYNKQYVIQRAPSLFSTQWTVLSTNTGTGGDMEFDDTSTAPVKFYRVEILP